MNDIYIDPITMDEVTDKATEDFEDILDDIEENDEAEAYEQMPWQEVAYQFYVNGYIHGGLEFFKNRKFRESIKLMDDEIKYQQK